MKTYVKTFELRYCAGPISGPPSGASPLQLSTNIHQKTHFFAMYLILQAFHPTTPETQ